MDLPNSIDCISLFAQRSSASALTSYAAGETPRAPEHRACCKLVVWVKDGFFWETPMRAPPAEYKLVLQFPLVFPSPLRPADYKSALVRPRWRVVSTVKVRAGVIP